MFVNLLNRCRDVPIIKFSTDSVRWKWRYVGVMPEGRRILSIEAVKGLMEVQECAFGSMIEIMFNGLKKDIKDVRKDVQDSRSSLEFSQTGISAIGLKQDAANSQTNNISPPSIHTSFVSLSNVHQYGTRKAIKSDIF